MNNEREMLEWAAKAAGLKLHPWSDMPSGDLFIDTGADYPHLWSPFKYNDDCARLEAACKLNVFWFEDKVAVGANSLVEEQYADHNGDRQKARRYASTRAAAQIGKEMSHG
jgi:hypothetical protein